MKSVHCPHCDSAKTLLVLKSKDYFLTQELFQIYKCTSCKISFTDPIPDNKIITKYYQSDSYVSHGQSRSILDSVYVLARKYTLNWKVKILKSLISQGTVLDFGCGTGDFLKICKDSGFQIQGIEPAAKAREQAEYKTKTKIHENISELKGDKYGIITLWHVLEHVHNLKTTLLTLKDKLSTDGKILIAVPNHLSYDAKYFKEYWAAYDLPRHIWHFNYESMSSLLDEAGLVIVKTVAMKLDAYYISLLSNKYQNRNTFFKIVNSIVVGLTSNIKAKQNDNYSSVLFIVKRK